MDNVHHSHPEEGAAYLSQLASLFASKGWLNQRLRISYQDQDYWLSCTSESFCAYLVNQDGGISPGAPGWPVCMVTKAHVFDESDRSVRSVGSDLLSSSPRAQDWLAIMSNGSFKMA
ncbi:MAG: hypothetical protein HYY01_15455 [Chloroflexi bacterium]|nr:hypothetical protein [Chloroflexota bacterium]